MVSRTSGTAVVISNAIDVTDRAARLLGVPTSFAVSGTYTGSMTGTATVAIAAANVVRIKAGICTTNATAGSRQLGIGVRPISSKIVAAGSSNADLLDREITVSGQTLVIVNGLAGDTWWLLYETVV
jgi:hypothetical protein